MPTQETPHISMPSQLLSVLRCPASGQRLRLCTKSELAEANLRILQGQMVHGDASIVTTPLQAAVQTSDGAFLYRIEDGIFVLLTALAMRPASHGPTDRHPTALRGEKQAVQSFYDELGWTRNHRGEFVDAEQWEDLRPVAREYVATCHQRVERHLQPTGRFLLDVASGPVQYAAYERYSAGYEARICVDISLTALKHAQARLGAHGVYIVGDISNLPLQDQSMDGVVSLHTIYHLPGYEQSQAFGELHRVLAPGCSAVVVYVWKSALVKLAECPASLVRRCRKWCAALLSQFRKPFRDLRQTVSQPADSTNRSRRLFFHSHPYRWFARQAWPFRWDVRVWRSLSLRMQRSYFHGRLAGRLALRCLLWLEDRWPRLLGRWGAYPLIVIHGPPRVDARDGDQRSFGRAPRRTPESATTSVTG